MNVRMLLAVVLALLPAGWSVAQGVDMPQPRVTDEQVQQAIDKMVAYLYQSMSDRGDWEEVPNVDGYTADKFGDNAKKKKDEYGGRTALVCLALLYAGEKPDNDKLAKSLAFLKELDLTGTYATGIRASVWSKMYNQKIRSLLKRDAQWLVEAATKTDGEIPGFFSYVRPCPGYGDHSNTQYGVLGLRDCAVRNLEIPLKYWEAIEKHMIETQGADGGWGYGVRDPNPPAELTYGNMTVGCLANLYITLDMLNIKYEGPFNGREAKNCGRRKPPEAIDRGLAWLDKNLPVDFGLKPKSEGTPNPAVRDHGMNLYYMYGLERCGHASGRKTFGGLNWFEEGALWTLGQLGSRNHFPGYYGAPVVTSWAVLFLSKGMAPVYYNKLDTGGDWNNKLRDIPNLSAYIGEKLEQRINWQVVDIDDPVETWLDSPILFFSGHEMPSFTDEQKQKLRLYTDSGGTIVAQACCSRDEFSRGFKQMAKEVWPEWELQIVDRKHPMLNAHHTITGRIPTMMHIDDGTRSCVFLLTQAMAGAWNQNLQTKYEPYFKIGMNLARYASDARMIRSRLAFYAKPVLAELAAEGKDVPVRPADEATLGIVDYPTDGKRLTAIRGLRHLGELLDETAAVKLQRTVVADHQLDGLQGAKIVRLSGLHTFSLSDENVAALKAFIDRGGLILADAQMGADGFNESFPKLLEKLAPGAQLEDVPQTDPIITGQGLPRAGFDVTRVRYKRALKFNEFRVNLKQVRLNGRRVVLYSPWDLTSGLDGHDAWGCKGLERNDALKLCTNIALSVLGDGDKAAGE